MSVRRAISAFNGLYFITFTCHKWLHLFEIANGYDAVYKWFEYLREGGHFICGYVIMPNHVHVLIAFRNTNGKSINQIIGNGKTVYGVCFSRSDQLLKQLSSFVRAKYKSKGKLHEVFESSFDCKECYSEAFIEQKLNYIHKNPCRGKWTLAQNPWEYVHSSAQFYYTGKQGIFSVTSYMELKDIDLTKSKVTLK